MRHVFILIAIAAIAIFVTSCGPDVENDHHNNGHGADNNNQLPPIPPGGTIIAKDGWYLVIEYRHKGTKSEGQTGTLYHGRDLVPGTTGKTLSTPIGKLKYYGDKPKNPWDPVGWNYADKKKIKNSWE